MEEAEELAALGEIELTISSMSTYSLILIWFLLSFELQMRMEENADNKS